MSQIQQSFPTPQTPVFDKSGLINPIWQRFFTSLWNRTGGSTGTGGSFAPTNGSASNVFNAATANTPTEVPPLAQVQSLDSTVLNTAETFATNAANTAQSNAEAFTSASYAPLASPALTGTPSAPTAAAGTNTTQLATTAFATGAANTAQSNAETYALNEIQTGTGSAFVNVTAGASPYTYTSTAVGNLVIAGGTVTAITLSRGASSVTLPIATPIVPMDNTDAVQITYSAAPTLTWIPR